MVAFNSNRSTTSMVMIVSKVMCYAIVYTVSLESPILLFKSIVNERSDTTTSKKIGIED